LNIIEKIIDIYKEENENSDMDEKNKNNLIKIMSIMREINNKFEKDQLAEKLVGISSKDILEKEIFIVNGKEELYFDNILNLIEEIFLKKDGIHSKNIDKFKEDLSSELTKNNKLRFQRKIKLNLTLKNFLKNKVI
jgi:hypothetical protein